MASASRAPPAQRKPDVFVNFRGEDTRKSFVSHLIHATEENGIFAFTDEGLRGGDDISTTLVNKIFESQVAVVVFSPNYANSRWCLDELVHIIQCKQQQEGRMVIPVFLQGVKPTHVRHQTGPFGDGFKESAGRYPDKNDAWIHALRQTADLSSGAYDNSSEAEIVDRLIDTILSFLGKIGSHDYDWGYFGKHHIEEVKSRLSSQDVNSIGIWGMGGSGKTTLARKVFDHISNNFAGVCFLENVRDRAKKGELNQLQSMFLDITCLRHSDGDCMEIILKTCGFGSIRIIDHLIDKALITINRYNKLDIHDLLQQMGDEIGKHSRLWKWKETANVLSSNMETSRIEVISPVMSIGKKVKLQPDVFKDMGRLRILCLRKGCAENILMSRGLKYLPTDLRYLEWNNYPLPSLPSHIDLENLVELRMRDSSLKKLWSGKLYLPNLKCIDLSYSKNLSQLPDLSGALRLETLELRLCGNVQDTHVSVKHLAELKHLDLSFTGLIRCPELSKFKKLEHLALESCGKITELPQLPKSLIHINLIHTNIKELPRGIQKLSQLTQLLCQGCEELESLPSNIGELQYLEELDISFCSKIRSLPTSVGDLHSLVKLSTVYSGLTCLPEEIENLANLRKLDMSYCTNLKTLPDGIQYLANLKVIEK